MPHACRASLPAHWQHRLFQEVAEGAKRGCPLSKALAGVAEITLTATLKA